MRENRKYGLMRESWLYGLLSTLLDIDYLIEIVRNGGMVKTGVDVYNHEGLLLIKNDVSITDVNTLINIEKNGVETVAIESQNDGGVWDSWGRKISLKNVIKKNRKKKHPYP